MKSKLIIALTIVTLSTGSWVNTPEQEQVKVNQKKEKTAPLPLTKKTTKKGVKLLFESVLYHFM